MCKKQGPNGRNSRRIRSAPKLFTYLTFDAVCQWSSRVDGRERNEQADEERNSSLALLMRDGYARTNLERVDERQDHWPRRHAD